MPLRVSGTHVSKKMIILIFTSPAADKTAIKNCTFHNFCRAPCDLDNLANGILRCHKLQGVFTEVSEYMHVVFNTKIEVFLFFSAWVGDGGVRLCVSCTSQR